MNYKQLRSSLTLVLVALIWGVAFVAQSEGMELVQPFTFNATRMIIGSIFLMPCIRFLDMLKKKNGEPVYDKNDSKARRTLLVGGVCCGVVLFIASSFQQSGIQFTSVGKAGFITALYIVIVPLLGIFLKRKTGMALWISVALAVVGMYFLCMTETLTIGKGDLLCICCAFFFSVHILVIDHFSPRVDGVRMSCIQFFVCGVLSAIAMFIYEQPNLGNILRAWLPILYAGIMSSGVAYTLQIVVQKDINPTLASLIMSLESVFSALAGWAILGQTLSGRELMGCVLVFAAIILAQLPFERKTAKKN